MANCVKHRHLCAKSSISYWKFKFSKPRPDTSFNSLYESLFILRNVNADLTWIDDEFRLHGWKTGL
ncbi:hypothetical protein BN2497_8671 [Janthinobacterium sp. CG23_2]|nr:hypothetical protein BN2497_8671 [Janthinobacterium sp. CG23_2]CUU30733.1 hypothetical protein BN3177_8671 [Janthinobacterium sp. CG23_2]